MSSKSSTTQKVVLAVIGLIAAYFVLHWVIGLAVSLVVAILPIVIIAGALYGGYVFFGKKALGGGRRTLP